MNKFDAILVVVDSFSAPFLQRQTSKGDQHRYQSPLVSLALCTCSFVERKLSDEERDSSGTSAFDCSGGIYLLKSQHIAQTIVAPPFDRILETFRSCVQFLELFS